MGAEEESVEQAAAARRERLKALRAAKELLSTPDDGPARSAQTENGTVANDFTGEEKKNAVNDEQDLATQVAAARHDMLKDLREAKELLNGADKDPAEAESRRDSEDDEDKPSVRFRNYVPHDKQLQEHKLTPPVLPKFEDPIAADPVPANAEDPFVNIAPKKPNWDLQRDVQKRLDKLERRTQKALYQLALEQEKENMEKLALESNSED